MATFQGILLLFFGFGLIGVDYQSLSKGVLPCGSKGFNEKLEFSRSEQPALYWLMFSVYGGAGLWLIVLGLRILTGHATPLPLR